VIRRGRELAWAFAAVAAWLAFPPLTAAAGTIGFRTDAEVTAGPGVDAKITITHTGDEAASGVGVRAELLGRSVDGEEVPSIPPGGTHVWNLHLSDEVPRGAYAILLRTRYMDDNGYPFEVLGSAMAAVGVKAAPRVFGSIDVPRVPVDGTVTATVTAKKPAARSGTYEATLAVPEGLEASPSKVLLEFDSSGKAKAQFQLRNRRLLAGTSVNVFAIVRGVDGGFPQDDTIRGTVTVGAAVVRITADMFYKAAAALAGLLVVLEASAWAAARRRRSVA
jgi:hypothetical protein